MPLKIYHKKRNFKHTSEPKGRIKSTKTKYLYVVQKHAASHLHYDFRLEMKGVLLSWAVPKGPCLDPHVKRLAVHVEDHPLEYGNFEGSIPQGHYGGGTVMLWDRGEWVPESDNPLADYKKGHLKFTLKGNKLKGSWALVRIKSDPKNWLLIKSQDDYSKSLDEYDIVQKKKKSVLSKMSMEQLEKKYSLKKNNPPKKNKPQNTLKKNTKVSGVRRKMPSMIKPQLATLVDAPPKGDHWFHEIKFDGYRLIAIITNKKVKLMTRGNQDWTSKFPNIVNALNELSLQNTILDGEVVILDEKQHSNFQLLQNAMKDNKKSAFIYYIFDVIYHNGHDLSSVPLFQRKEILHKIIKKTTGILRYSDHVKGSGEKVFSKSCKLKLEGIVSKDMNSPYIQSRTHHWLKVKCSKRQEFVIGGYTQPSGRRAHFGSLLIGIYKNKKLIYCGHVGTGFTSKSLSAIYSVLKKNETNKMPFNDDPPDVKNVQWVKPVLVAEVEFTELTAGGILRHPSFKGLRSDKMPKEITREHPVSLNKKNDNTLTHPDKILYPEDHITKADLFEYYKNIQKWILPYIMNRLLTLVRCPEGYNKSCFFQKHIESKNSKIKTISVKSSKKKENDMYIDSVEGLLTFPQLGVLEIHTWGSSIKNIEKPDILVFDLDPAPDVKWNDVVKAALEVKKQLQKYKLISFVKTTGGKGLHIVIPIKPEYTWDEIKIFSQTFVNYLVQLHPDKYVGSQSKSRRKGKIFIDYLRNVRGATAVAPFSTRAKAHAPVATPLHWSELSTNIKNTSFTIKTIFKRLEKMKKDPWKDFFKVKQSLNLEKLS